MVIDRADIQGNVLRGYHKEHVRHLVLEVTDRRAAREWLRDATSGDPSVSPQISDDRHWGPDRPEWRLNVGFAYAGLAALGLRDSHLRTFPEEFRDGMASRATRI